MGIARITRSEILEEIRNVAIKNPDSEEGTATFELKLGKRIEEDDEVSGSLALRITHAKFPVNKKDEANILKEFKESDLKSARAHEKEKKTDELRANERAARLAKKGDTKGHVRITTKPSEKQPTTKSPVASKVRLQKVFKGGSLKKRTRNVLSFGSSWQSRYFEVREDGSIAWGLGNVDSSEWKAQRITKVRAEQDMKKNTDFEFEIEVEGSRKPLQLRASDERRFQLWLKYLEKVCEGYDLGKIVSPS